MSIDAEPKAKAKPLQEIEKSYCQDHECRTKKEHSEILSL
jgi:hypothetical protein